MRIIKKKIGLQEKMIDIFNIDRLTKFGLVGVLATIVYYLELWIMVELFELAVLVATSSAFILITIQNYILHHNWTFQSNSVHFFAFPRFLFMNFIGFWINWFVMFLGVEVLTFNYLFVQAGAIGFVVVWNFALSYFWIFNEK